MSGFIARPAPPAEGSANLVANDGWWPSVDVNLVRLDERLDTIITPERLREAVVNAVIAANDELEPWRLCRVAQGYAALGEVPDREVGGEKVKATQYRRAIATLVAADLKERERDIATSTAGEERLLELTTNIDDLRRAYRWAISDLQKIPRTTVELI